MVGFIKLVGSQVVWLIDLLVGYMAMVCDGLMSCFLSGWNGCLLGWLVGCLVMVSDELIDGDWVCD